MSRKLTVVTCLAAGVITGLAVGGYAIATNDTVPPQRFDHISNTGIPAMGATAKNATLLLEGGAKADLRRLAIRGPMAFYVAPGAGSGLCFGTGPVSTEGLATLACPPKSGRLNFPSDQAPIVSLAGTETESDGNIYFLELAGLAADGVDRVGIIDADGSLHDTTVADNVFYRDLPRTAARVLVAFDSSGAEVFRHVIGRGD